MKYTVCLIILFTVLIISSCSPVRSAQGDSGSVYLDYNIVTGELGGFTGANSGHSIDTTGMIKSFSGIALENAKKTDTGRLTEEQILKLNKLIPELLRVKYSEKGNLTSYIALSKGDKKIEYSWPGQEPGKTVPDAIRIFYAEVSNMINAASTN